MRSSCYDSRRITLRAPSEDSDLLESGAYLAECLSKMQEKHRDSIPQEEMLTDNDLLAAVDTTRHQTGRRARMITARRSRQIYDGDVKSPALRKVIANLGQILMDQYEIDDEGEAAVTAPQSPQEPH